MFEDAGEHELKGVPVTGGACIGSSARRLPRDGPQEAPIRPPGLKPTTKVGTLGPYRGRLGLAWVIAPLVAGVVIVVAGYLALFR